jgi:4Fe-4S ferredoxin
MKPAIVKDGRVIRPSNVEIDESRCIFCGICSVLCPLNAITTWVNGVKNAMFVASEAFPELVKLIEVDCKRCQPDCAVKCVDSCPRDALKVDVDKRNGKVQAILDVHVDLSQCMFCKACEHICPYNAITVVKPFEGLINLEHNKCPIDCRICVDICPTDALQALDSGEIKMDANLCIACKACQILCPEDAISVMLTQVRHTPIQSSTWIHILQRFASISLAVKELASKAAEKRKSRIQTLPVLEEL